MPGQKALMQGGEPATNSTHIWLRHQDSNVGHIGGGKCSHHCATLALPALDLTAQPCSFSKFPKSVILQINDYTFVIINLM